MGLRVIGKSLPASPVKPGVGNASPDDAASVGLGRPLLGGTGCCFAPLGGRHLIASLSTHFPQQSQIKALEHRSVASARSRPEYAALQHPARQKVWGAAQRAVWPQLPVWL